MTFVIFTWKHNFGHWQLVRHFTFVILNASLYGLIESHRVVEVPCIMLVRCSSYDALHAIKMYDRKRIVMCIVSFLLYVSLK